VKLSVGGSRLEKSTLLGLVATSASSFQHVANTKDCVSRLAAPVSSSVCCDIYANVFLTCSDSRIPALIRNGLQEKKRSFFVVVGDHAKDAIVHRESSPILSLLLLSTC